jgi:hypothetical protein
MKIYLFVNILALLFITAINKMKGFNRLEFFWVVYTLLFIKWLSIVNLNIRVIAIMIALSIDAIRGPLLFTLSLPLCMVKGYNIWRCSAYHTFNTCMNLKLQGYELPEKPTIYLCNYPANFVEYQVNTLLHRNVCIIAYGKNDIETTRNKRIVGDDRIITISKGKDNFDEAERAIKEKMEKGYHIVAYVEKNFQKRSHCYSIDRLSTGMFHIAKKLDVTITPVVIDHIDHTIGIPHSNTFNIYIGKTEKILNHEIKIQEVTKLFKRQLRKFSIK